jgi:hypothetical protein
VGQIVTLDWADMVLAASAILGALGWAYESGQRSMINHCHELLARSHLAQAVQLSQVRTELNLPPRNEFRQ